MEYSTLRSNLSSIIPGNSVADSREVLALSAAGLLPTSKGGVGMIGGPVGGPPPPPRLNIGREMPDALSSASSCPKTSYSHKTVIKYKKHARPSEQTFRLAIDLLNPRHKMLFTTL